MTTIDCEDCQDEYMEIPLIQGVVLKRGEDNTPMTNVPHLVVHHSQEGYEWGYAGSGPSDLALNIAENWLRLMNYSGETIRLKDTQIFLMAWNLHQRLKWRFISSIHAEGGTIDCWTLTDWIKEQMEELPPGGVSDPCIE